MEQSNEKSIGALVHLSALSQFVFPFGNYIFPLIIWTLKKRESTFIDENGKQIINFQLSTLVYSLVFIVIAIPTFVLWLIKVIASSTTTETMIVVKENISTENMNGFILLGLTSVILLIIVKLSELFLIIYASVKAANGEIYKYPLTIKFIK